ncbi:TraU family protein [Pasteurella atlantica]|uniref:TraU family protein n=2 Tax=Pasteurellaceae TaxID=712 RepID=A0ACC6HKZ5_9PAST|nr:TraU family protein [Pasteurella atlantica]MDP8051530.1 TraU family protein [Pasteurella atlantica]MDP8104891.1 TraU family protein [Pasteurella atlantica]MDP8148265.1 TraU family protein [Pasteurella atlantica]
MRKILSYYVIGMGLLNQSLYAEDMPTVKVNKMNISQVFTETINSVPDCIEYCVDGISLYAIITPFGVDFEWVLNISHNSPDFLVMSHDNISDTPWQEFDRVFGSSYTSITEDIIKGITGINVEAGGGRGYYKKWGQHQSVSFKESTILGHPASLVLKMFNSGGVKPKGKMVRSSSGNKEFVPCKTNGCLEEENSSLGNSIRQENKLGGISDASTYDWLKHFYQGYAMNTTPTIVNGFGGNMNNMNEIANNNNLSHFMQKLGNAVSNMEHSGGAGNRLFCPISVTPFMPYYLSGLDALEWRSGYPTSDVRYSDEILNPLSTKTIGTKVQDRLQLGNLQYNLPMINEIWGKLYPREGTLEHQWDSKRATVIAARAVDIMREDTISTRIRYQPDKSNNGFGGWGKVFPVSGDTTPGQKVSSCHKNIANTGMTNNETGGYSWTYWRRYNCDMREPGVYITTVKFPQPICFTSKVPE